ncbi:MAG: hypothetical protein IJZ42_13535 [Lachnospiraceae bacterium]|nr:hypothetical protein [Lachnospiraceae bacterium]
MDSIPRFLVSIVLILLCTIIGISLIFTSFYISSARSYHDQVIKVVSASDFAASEIQYCMNDAQAKGYALSIQPTQDGHIYRVDLTYNVSVPIFGKWTTKTITGYAIDYAALAVAAALE